MFLKRLELQGFKSFPEKIKLEFKKGVTAVVGPNGSGKSNISDAIRWVIGEQNAKSLRGDKMEDIIFAGTKNRRPLGFAEVSLVMDNEDRKLNIDFNEVTVTRRVYRSGDSGFFINGSSCRLKDIHKLFMDTGIGKEGYSIIGQGKIDAILNSKSEDRRLLFEEAAGIVGFKKAKADSEKKLAETQNNLVRTNDIISEIESRMPSLEKQAERTKQYLRLADEYKSVRTSMFVNEYKISEKQTEEISGKINIVSAQIEDTKNKLESKQEENKEIRAAVCENERKTEECNNKIAENRSETDQRENDIKLVNRDIVFADREIERVKAENESRKKSLLEIDNSKAINETKKQGLEIELSSAQSRLEAASKEFEEISSIMNESGSSEDSYNEKIKELMAKAAEINTDIQKVKLLNQQYSEKRQRAASDISSLKVRLNESNVKIKALEVKLQNAESQRSLKLESISDSENTEKALKNEAEALKSKHINLTNEFKALESKCKFLTEMSVEYEGYNNSVKNILQKRRTEKDLTGVVGAVAELISVSKEYETAIETALGAAAQNIVVKDELSAKQAINYLKRTAGGRATFLPLTTIKARSLNNAAVLEEKGILGIADALIGYDKKYHNIISNLLGKTVISDNIDNAVSAAGKYGYSFRIVTLDGQIVNAGGSLTGGSTYKKSAGIFSREREINELVSKMKAMEGGIKEAEENRIRAEIRAQKISSQLENFKSEINALAIELNDIKHKIDAEKTGNSLIRKNYEEAEAILSDAEENISETEKIIFEKQEIYEEYNKKTDEISAEFSKYREEQQKSREVEKEGIRKINAFQMQITDIKNKISNVSLERERIEADEIRINKEISDSLMLIEEKEREKEESLKKIEDIKKYIEGLKERLALLQDKIKELNNEKSQMSAKYEEENNEILELTKQDGILNNEKIRLEAQKESIDAKIKKLCDEMWEDYEMTYASAANSPQREESHSELQKLSGELKREINSLGNINPNAVEEFNEVKERYDFNVKQRDDIIKAGEDIKKIIADLAEDMEVRFKEQFAVINENFKKVFSQMFNGGTANLKIEDEENVLTSGIEIAAQPPGKTLQTLSLLSGGERTLTAMSLLFAILVMKPSPFCVLDETEAALDDANVNRYADFLKRFAQKNQFIVITHKQGTMEIADTLYGVTMEEQGVSKIISVNLEDVD